MGPVGWQTEKIAIRIFVNNRVAVLFTSSDDILRSVETNNLTFCSMQRTRSNINLHSILRFRALDDTVRQYHHLVGGDDSTHEIDLETIIPARGAVRLTSALESLRPGQRLKRHHVVGIRVAVLSGEIRGTFREIEAGHRTSGGRREHPGTPRAVEEITGGRGGETTIV